MRIVRDYIGLSDALRVGARIEICVSFLPFLPRYWTRFMRSVRIEMHPSASVRIRPYDTLHEKREN